MIRIVCTLIGLMGCMSFQTAHISQSSISLQNFDACRRFSALRVNQICVRQSKFTSSPRRNSLSPLFSTPKKTESSGGYAILRDLLGGMPVLGGYSSFSELFAKFDKDVSGKISLQELQSTLKEMGAPLSNKQVNNSDISYTHSHTRATVYSAPTEACKPQPSVCLLIITV